MAKAVVDVLQSEYVSNKQLSRVNFLAPFNQEFTRTRGCTSAKLILRRKKVLEVYTARMLQLCL